MRSKSDRSDMGERLPTLEISSGLRAIIKDLVNPCLQLRGPLLHHLQSLQRILQLRDISGSDKGRIQVVVFDGPGNGQMGQLAVEFFLGQLGEGLETGDDFGLGESLVEYALEELVGEVLVLVVEPIDLVLSNSLEVSAGKETASKGTPGYEAILVILIETEVFDLIFSPLEHVVFILSTNRFMQVQSLTSIQGIEHHLRIPVRGGPVEDLACFDGLMETAANLFNRGQVILEVGIEDVHVVHLQSLQAAIQALLDVLAGDEVVRVDILDGCEADLGGDDDLLSRDLEVLEDLAQLGLGSAIIVALGSIEVVDAVLERHLDDLLIDGVGLLLGVDHVSQGDDGGLQAGTTEVPVGHLAGLEVH